MDYILLVRLLVLSIAIYIYLTFYTNYRKQEIYYVIIFDDDLIAAVYTRLAPMNPPDMSGDKATIQTKYHM